MGLPKIVIIGSGNVATHLSKALDQHGRIAQVYSPNFFHAQELASSLTACTPISEFASIDRDADFYIISVKDDAIASVAASLPPLENGIVVHTSGSVPMDALIPTGRPCGVLYPLQTFTKGCDIDMHQVPFFTEASDPDTLAKIDMLAHSISGNVRHADSAQRAVLHIAAVFACNFANYLWGISADLLREGGYPFEVLRPLIEATLSKAVAMGPKPGQTGPAARADVEIIRKHLSQLDGDAKELYKRLSQAIIDSKNLDITIYE